MSNLLYHLRGVITLAFILCNTIIHTLLLIPFAAIKLAVPMKSIEARLTKIHDGIGESWIACNHWFFKLSRTLNIEVSGDQELERAQWYLCVANHQSWADVLVIQFVLNRKIPFLKFFIKKQLLWLPIFGAVWYAMDFPFMSRYSKEQIRKKPHLRGKDIETTRKACQKFKYKPVSIMNFVEGTRYTKAKHAAQNSPYTHLLKPRAGGIAFVLEALDGKINKILSMSIVYQGSSNFWYFLCGKTKDIRFDVETLDVDPSFVGSYQEDEIFRKNFQSKVTELWRRKDIRIEEMKF